MRKKRILLGLMCLALNSLTVLANEKGYEPNNVNVAMRAFELRMAGKIAEAMELLEKTVAANPKNAPTHS